MAASCTVDGDGDTSDTMSKFIWRNASLDDLPAIMAVEASWPEEARASEDKFRARLAKFSRGFFIAFDRDSGAPAATITCMPANYDQGDLGGFKDWDTATNHGILPDHVDPKEGNALYIVSGVIATAFRGYPLFEEAMEHIIGLGRELNKDYVLAGAVIPGFDRFYEKNPGVSAAEYCFKRRGTHLLCPLLAMYEKIGFSLPDHRHVIAEYFPDTASRNYGALVVKRLSDE